MTNLEFFYDYGSPYSYLANKRLPALAERTGCEIHYRPMLLGGVFKATGNRSPAEETVPARRQYFGRELERWVEYLGVPFKRNPHFPINTLMIMRAAHAAQRTGVFELFHQTVYSAFWEQEKNLGDVEIAGAVLSAAGLDARALLEATRDPKIKEALKATTEEAVERGAFGAPTFFVGDQMFFGNDRLDFVERALMGEKHA